LLEVDDGPAVRTQSAIVKFVPGDWHRARGAGSNDRAGDGTEEPPRRPPSRALRQVDRPIIATSVASSPSPLTTCRPQVSDRRDAAHGRGLRSHPQCSGSERIAWVDDHRAGAR
jgi:hypothetical protein